MKYTYIKGFEELEKALSEFPQKLLKNAMRRALYAGVKIIATEAKIHCPVAPPSQTASVKYGAKTGDLRRSIKIGANTIKGTSTVYGYVRAGNFKAYYARWVEFGTAAHRIAAKGGALSFDGNFYKSVAHPGATPHPFMRPALDAKWREALEAVAASLADSIEKNLPTGNS
jgi:HK97 gp10 family phage protein